MRNYICNTTFYTYKISKPVVNEIIFFTSKVKDPFILLNLKCKGLESIKILYEMLRTKLIPYDFSSTKMLSKSNLKIFINHQNNSTYDF